ncbi:unnamed protein product [Anisakis simplex]|uniref:CBS domain-containing protein n=1 Tax=Anisakis simplex TaxID=6269 RepID=A0A0M3JLR2_ANISI|nr:unnamed protein product [Anisakis simplex]
MHPSQTVNSVSLAQFCKSDLSPPPSKRSRWMGNTKQLTSSVSTIDDRLAFMRICEELDRRNVKYKPLITEPTVGGLLLQITELVGLRCVHFISVFVSIYNLNSLLPYL